MKTVLLHNLLLSLTVQGLLWTLLLLVLCFVGVYVAGLARLGWEYKKESPTPASEPTKEEKRPLRKSRKSLSTISSKRKNAARNRRVTASRNPFNSRKIRLFFRRFTRSTHTCPLRGAEKRTITPSTRPTARRIFPCCRRPPKGVRGDRKVGSRR